MGKFFQGQPVIDSIRMEFEVSGYFFDGVEFLSWFFISNQKWNEFSSVYSIF
jgi:hypothetical protein